MDSKPSIMFVGGFLGAGKTTAIRALGQTLSRTGMTVAAITNDQAAGLVDTLFLRQAGIETHEVAGSCFCCDFNGLSDAIEEIIGSGRTDIILAEPVGSCTDIVATVIRPMRNRLSDRVRTLSFSVLAEPQRWREIASRRGLETASVAYLFNKQLQEADFIVITKADTLGDEEKKRIVDDARSRYPEAEVLAISARNGDGLTRWFERVRQAVPGERWLRDIDYGQYAEAEADMGWLNAEVALDFDRGVDLEPLVLQVVDGLRAGVAGKKGQIGNLKLLARSGDEHVKCGVTSVDSAPQLEGSFSGPGTGLSLTVNIRATLAPDDLTALLRRAMDEVNARRNGKSRLIYLYTFRPAPPNPTYRYT